MLVCAHINAIIVMSEHTHTILYKQMHIKKNNIILLYTYIYVWYNVMKNYLYLIFAQLNAN